MHWLQQNLTQQGFIKLSTMVAAMLFTSLVLILSVGSQPGAVYAQAQTETEPQDCIPSLHRLLIDGQQVAVEPSLIQEFVDDTPVFSDSVTRRIDDVVIEEGFASIPLSASLSRGSRRPNLRSSGFVFENSFFPEYTVWHVRNQSNAEQTVTVRSQPRRVFNFFRFRFELRPSTFSRTVTIPAYSDGFVRSSEVGFFERHELIFNNRVIDRERNRFTLYRDARTIQSGSSQPLFEVLQQIGLVNIANDELPSSINLTAAGIFAGSSQRTVWKISNGTDTDQAVTLQALDSDDERTFTVPANTDAYVISDEDGCIDNPDAELQEALWVAESEGLLKVLTQSGDIAFELAISDPIEAINVSPQDRTVWIVTQGGRLEGFDSNGISISDTQIGITTPVTALNVGTTHAWLITEGQLLIIDRAGTQALQIIDLGEAATALSYDSIRDRVWVQLPNALIAIDSNGQTQDSIDLSPDTVVLSVYDRRLDNLWVISSEQTADIISRYKSDGRLVRQTNTNTSNNWSSASADSRGGLWLANNTELTHVLQSTAIDFSLPAFADLNDNQIVDIAAGSSDQSVWVANQTQLRQYSLLGELIHSITPDMGDGVIRNLNRIDLFSIMRTR